MTAVGRLEGTDPTDLDDLREALKPADPEGKLAPIGMSRVEIGPDALNLLPEVVSEVARGAPRVALVTAAPQRRDGGDLKARVERLLGRRFEVRRPVIGARRAALHADEEALDETAAAVAGADCVVVVGAGPNAFSDDMAVRLEAGTKRTVTSRWPDVLLIDIPVLACAPLAMNLAGFGDLISMWTAPADWYLASALGMDDPYHEAPVALVREKARELLENAARLRDPEALDKLARVLTLSGFNLGGRVRRLRSWAPSTW
jgi:glycerol-1-phosphate dehydrogenase [NAD(P)+]